MSRATLLPALLILLGLGSMGTAAYLLLKGNVTPARVAAEQAPDGIAAEESALLEPITGVEQSPQPAALATRSQSEARTAFSIVIHDGQDSKQMQTNVGTVGELLAEAGIILGEKDRVTPPPETPLADKMELQIRRAIPLTVQVDGQTYAIFSAERTVGEVLTEVGLTPGELDIVSPVQGSEVHAGDMIQLTRAREELLVEEEEIPFQTLYQPSAELDLDTKAVISQGIPGLLRRSMRIRYKDGVEVSREVEGEWVEREPVNEVIGFGTHITTNMIDTPEGPREYWRVVHMRVTAYTAASSGKPPNHPAYGITASGLPAGTGIVAVDPNVIPFRSEVYVPGYGVGFAGDTGGGVKGRWIDLGYDEDELQTWNGYVDVYYLTPIPAEINYLIPEVLP